MSSNRRSSAKQKAHAQRLRRARTAVTGELGWLKGVPDGDGRSWLRLDDVSAPAEVELTRELLTQSFRSFTKLTRTHHDLLPELFERPDLWQAGVRTLLGYVQALVHDDIPLPLAVIDDLGIGTHTAARARRLNEDPTLAPFVADLSWLGLTEPHLFRKTLATLDEIRYPVSLTNDRVRVHRLLVLATRHGAVPGYLDGLLPSADGGHLANPVQDANRLSKLLRQVRNGTTTEPPTSVDTVEIGQRLDNHLRDLLSLAPDRYRELTRIGEATGGLDINAVVELHNQLAPLLDQAMVVINQALEPHPPQRDSRFRKRVRSLAEKIEEARDALRDLPSPTKLLTVLLTTSDATGEDLTSLAELLEAAPGKLALPLLARWRSPLLEGLQGRRKIMRLQTELFAAGHQEWFARLGPATVHHHFERDLLTLKPESREMTLLALGQTRTLDAIDIIDLVRGGFSEVADICAIESKDLPSLFVFYEPSALDYLRRRCGSIELFLRVCEIMQGSADQIAHPRADPVWDRLVTWGLPPATFFAVDAKAGTRSIMLRAVRLAKAGADLPTPPASPPATDGHALEWLERFPARFRDALIDVERFTGHGQVVGEAVLGKSFPEEDALHRQVAALTEAIDNGGPAHLRERRDNLLRRLQTPDGEELDRLERRLRAKATETKIRAFGDALDDALDGLVAARVGKPLNVTSDARMLTVAALDLDDPYRTLALDIIAASQQGDRYDVLRHHANQSFLDEARSAGHDLTPWLTGSFSRHIPNSGVVVDLEHDPNEILQMGRPFSTCLAPGHMNFWSAVVNAVDVNKAVIVGRDGKGKTVARCLLALDTNYRILSYYPYAHEKDSGFKAVVAEITTDLAAAIGTEPAPSGTVPPLVTNAWYDDGPMALAANVLDTEGPFMKRLAVMDLAEFTEGLSAAGHGNTIVLRRLLSNKKIRARPEFVRALLTDIDQTAPRYFYDWILIFEGAALVGDHDLARTTARRQLLPYFRAHPDEIQYYAKALVDSYPVLGLQALRGTRPNRVRGDKDETDKVRIGLLADAHELLGRHLLADRLRSKLDTER